MKTNLFTLINGEEEYSLNYNPIGWESRNRSIVRNDDYSGLFRTFTADITFIRDGYTKIKSYYDNLGINAEIYLKVEKYNAKNDEFEQEAYALLDFKTFKITSEHGAGIKISLIDHGFAEQVKSRDKVEIPYDRKQTIDDEDITAFDSRSTVFDDATFNDQDGYRTAKIYGIDIADNNVECIIDNLTYSQDGGSPRYNILKIDTEYENPSFNNVAIRQGDSSILNNSLTSDCFFYTNGGATVDIDFSLLFDHRSTSSPGANDFELDVWIYKVTFDSNDEWVSKEEIYNFHQEPNEGTLYKKITSTFEEELEANQGLMLVVYQWGQNFLTVQKTYFKVINGYFNVDFSEKYAPTYCKTVLMHEFLTRLIENITGQQNAFYSTFFGRTDLGYDEDGEGAYLAITNGKLIRQFPVGFTEVENEKVGQLTAKFTELYESLDRLFCLGMTIKLIDGNYKVVIEKKIEFFSQEVVAEITSVEEKTFELELNEKLFYNNISSGSEIGEYEEVSGLQEYNNQMDMATFIKRVDNKLDLIIKNRIDGYGIEYCRRLVYSESQTTDSQYDNYNWLIDLVVGQDGNLYQRTTEGFSTVTGIPLISTPVNLNLTPKRQILNWGWLLNAGLWKYPNNFIKYSKSKLTTGLGTKKPGESSVIYENADIKNSSLDNPRHTGFNVVFNAPLSNQIWNVLDENPFGLLKYTNPNTKEIEYGNIIEASNNPVRNEPTNYILRQANPPTVGNDYVLVDNNNDYIVTNDENLIEIN